MFPLGAWVVGAAFLLVAGVMFAAASGQSIPQGMTLMARLFLQMGYEIPARRAASRSVLLLSALTLLLIYIYWESDLTATMTSKPPKLSIGSFEDVIDQARHDIAFERAIRIFFLISVNLYLLSILLS